MILDKVDFSHIASAFKLRDYTYSGCNPVSLSMPTSQSKQYIILERRTEMPNRHAEPDAASRERDIFELAKQRRRADAEQARLKLAKKEARSRIRQFEDQRKMEGIEIRTPQKSAEIAERDSGVFFFFEDPKIVASNAETVAKIVSKWRARARWSKALQKVRSLSSGSSNLSPSGQPTQKQSELLFPGTPTRTRASSTSSLMSGKNSDASLLKQHSSDLLSPFTSRRSRASSTDSFRMRVT
jgi:hypothetical protein